MKHFLFFVSLSISLFFFDRWGLTSPVRSVAELMSRPLRGFIFETKLSFREKIADWGKIREVGNLEKELERFKIENEALKLEVREAREENEAMRRLLGAPLPMDWKFEPVQILGEDEGVLVIGKGEREGVKEGMVAVWEKVLVGRVVEVQSHLALVETPLYSQVAILAETKEASGVVVCEGGEVFLTKVLQGEALAKEETVFTSGKEGKYPPDLLIAKVEEVILSEEQPFKKARLELMVDYRKLRTVFLVIE